MAKKTKELTFHFEGAANEKMTAERAAYEVLQSIIVALDNQRHAGVLSDKEYRTKWNALCAKHFGPKAVQEIE